MEQLPEWVDRMFLAQIVIWILVFAAFLGVIAKLWNPAKKFIAGIDTLFGTGKEDALADRLTRIEEGQASQGEAITKQGEMLIRVYFEVLPNHGTSLRDRVDCISRKVDTLADYQKRDYDRMKEHLKESETAKAVIEQLADQLNGDEDE